MNVEDIKSKVNDLSSLHGEILALFNEWNKRDGFNSSIESWQTAIEFSIDGADLVITHTEPGYDAGDIGRTFEKVSLWELTPEGLEATSINHDKIVEQKKAITREREYRAALLAVARYEGRDE
jgi:hypothetical protein